MLYHGPYVNKIPGLIKYRLGLEYSVGSGKKLIQTFFIRPLYYTLALLFPYNLILTLNLSPGISIK